MTSVMMESYQMQGECLKRLCVSTVFPMKVQQLIVNQWNDRV